MVSVIRAIAFANGVHCPHAGQWLESCDHDAYDGRGFATFTDNIDRAMRFENKGEAMVFWSKQSSVRPLRLDGRPNKPMTALTVMIEDLLC